METTVTTALSGLLQRPSGGVLLVTDVELDRRHWLSREMIRYAVTTISQINVLANVLATLHVNYLLSQSDGTVPTHFGSQGYFIWTFACCSTLLGKHVIPVQRQLLQKNAQGEKELVPDGPVAQDKRRTLETLSYVFKQIFLHLLPSNFQFPPRDGLNAELETEAVKRKTNFDNMCFTTLLGRQTKVLRWRVDGLVREHFPTTDHPSLSSKIYTQHVNATVTGATKIAYGAINGWRPAGTGDDHDRDATYQNDIKELFIPAPSKKRFIVSKTKRKQFQHDFECLLIEHRECIDTERWCDPIRGGHPSGVSEKTVQKHPASFLPYLAFLNSEYMAHNADLTDETRKFTWKSFAPIPQLSLDLAFIDITARGLCKWAAFSKTAMWKKHIDLLRKDLVDKHPCESIELDWICPDATGDVARWGDVHKEIVVDRFFNIDAFVDLNLSNQRKICAPTYTVSTDGQQAKIHIYTIRLDEHGVPLETIAPLPTITSRKRKKPPGDKSLHEDEIRAVVSKGEPTYVVSEAEFTSWINEGKTIISADPGHVSLVSAVRHLPISQHQIYDKICADHIDRLQDDAYQRAQMPSNKTQPPTTAVTAKKRISKTRRTILKQAKLADKHQSEYELSNKAYYEMCGFTSTRKQLQIARGVCGLSQMDLEMSAFIRKSFDNNQYFHWAAILLHPKWWNILWQEVTRPWYRKLRFHCYQTQQRAFSQIASQLCSGDGIQRQPNECIILWGNGGFAATGKGNAAAPNIGLRAALRRYGLRIYLVDEFRSSKLSSCCHKPLSLCYGSKNHNERFKDAAVLLASRYELRGVRVCKCHVHQGEEEMVPRRAILWSRDTSAAINIYDICKRNALQPAIHLASNFSRTRSL